MNFGIRISDFEFYVCSKVGDRLWRPSFELN